MPSSNFQKLPSIHYWKLTTAKMQYHGSPHSLKPGSCLLCLAHCVCRGVFISPFQLNSTVVNTPRFRTWIGHKHEAMWWEYAWCIVKTLHFLMWTMHKCKAMWWEYVWWEYIRGVHLESIVNLQGWGMRPSVCHVIQRICIKDRTHFRRFDVALDCWIVPNILSPTDASFTLVCVLQLIFFFLLSFCCQDSKGRH